MSKFTINSTFRMKSGYEIPLLGYGVYQTPAAVTESVVLKALEVGYRHVDSAIAYRNEAPCGSAIHKSGLKRSEIFFTSKIAPGKLGYKSALDMIENTLKVTGFDYIDLMLLHAPYGGREARKGAWKALVEAKDAGKIHSIGISNYGVHHLDEMEEYMKELEKEGGNGGEIDIGQWELHPWLPRDDIVQWCEKRSIAIEAYCPLVQGHRLGDKLLKPLVKKYGKTPAQILLRWSLQKGFIPLPKSVTPSRIEENAALFDFELTEEDMNSLKTTQYSPITWDPTVSGLSD